MIKFQPLDDGINICRCRESHIQQIVLIIIGIFRGSCIRTDTNRFQLILRILCPAFETLAQQGYAWHHIQHQALTLRLVLHDFERSICLTSTTRHNHLASVMIFKVFVSLCQRLDLVRAHRLAFKQSLLTQLAFHKVLPIYRRFLKTIGVNRYKLNGLVFDTFLRILTPMRGRGYPKQLIEAICMHFIIYKLTIGIRYE